MLWRLRAGRPSGFIEPCLPSIARKPPTGPQWLHEIKHDGYRHGGRVRLFTRRGFDWSDRFLAGLVAHSASTWPACADFDQLGVVGGAAYRDVVQVALPSCH